VPLGAYNASKGRWTIIVVDAFGDESADETQQRIFAVAAIAASDDEWKQLETAWLERTGPVRFHATDCESDRGDYKNFPHAENKALYRDLTHILGRSDAWGFGAAYDLASYRAIFPSVDQDTCYIRALLEVIGFFGRLSEQHFNKDVIRFTFDSREQSNYSAGKVYDLAVRDGENRCLFDEITFASSTSSKRHVALEMADLFAYETMKELDNRIGPVRRRRRRSLDALTERGHFGCDFFMREYFEDMDRKLGQVSKRDPAFSWESYQEWLRKYKKGIDSPRNRMLHFIWFGEQEQRRNRGTR